jgi:FkbM family methyltransferase
MGLFVRRHLRNLQSHFPWLRPLKFRYYNFAARHLGWHIDPHFFILKHLPQVSCAIDVGGNWGQSIHTIRRLRPAAQVTSFEPNPVLAEHLKLAFADDARVTMHELALSAQSGVMELHIPSYRHFVYDGLASLDRDEAEGWLGQHSLAAFKPELVSVRSCKVPVERLDAFALQPDFIKIDVQGHELAVLQGAVQTLAGAPVIMLEAASLEIVRYLSAYGLKPYRFDGRQLVLPCLFGNALFMSDEAVKSTGLPVVSMLAA